MYYPYFITYILLGFGISLIVFFWALKNGQFRDQQRARYLALEDEVGPEQTVPSKVSRYEAAALFLLAIAGLGACAAVLIYALFRHG
ncbi:MAG: cbb3-type cytochrome oxidase assembly protein CcoS [Desulfobacterales bacterium]